MTVECRLIINVFFLPVRVILTNHNFLLSWVLVVLMPWHDDVIKWKHFPRYWPFVRGIHRSPVNSPQKGQWRGALMFTLICARINGWVNNGEAGDLRRNRGHYDVIIMEWFVFGIVILFGGLLSQDKRALTCRLFRNRNYVLFIITSWSSISKLNVSRLARTHIQRYESC